MARRNKCSKEGVVHRGGSVKHTVQLGISLTIERRTVRVVTLLYNRRAINKIRTQHKASRFLLPADPVITHAYPQ